MQLKHSSDVNKIQTSVHYKLYNQNILNKNWLSESHTIQMGLYKHIYLHFQHLLCGSSKIQNNRSAHNSVEQLRVSLQLATGMLNVIYNH
jgi:hypothetical protein